MIGTGYDGPTVTERYTIFLSEMICVHSEVREDGIRNATPTISGSSVSGQKDCIQLDRNHRVPEQNKGWRCACSGTGRPLAMTA